MVYMPLWLQKYVRFFTERTCIWFTVLEVVCVALDCNAEANHAGVSNRTKLLSLYLGSKERKWDRFSVFFKNVRCTSLKTPQPSSIALGIQLQRRLLMFQLHQPDFSHLEDVLVLELVSFIFGLCSGQQSVGWLLSDWLKKREKRICALELSSLKLRHHETGVAEVVNG